MHASTVRNLLVRGMIAGVLAGLFAFALAYFAGEPSVRDSIAQEEANSAPAAPARRSGGRLSRFTVTGRSRSRGRGRGAPAW